MRYECIWTRTSYTARPNDYGSIPPLIGWDDEGITDAQDYLFAENPPTEAQFRAHIKKTVGATLPTREQPQWWTWDTTADPYWREAASTTDTVLVHPNLVTVYGTTRDRDRKRNALLEAAIKAGTP